MIRRLSFLLLTFITSLYASGQNYDFNDNCQSAYEAVISLQFNRATNLLAEEERTNPDNLIPVYLYNYIDFLKLVIGESKDSLEMLEKRKDDRLDMLKTGPEDSPFYLYCQANVNMHWAFSRLKFKEYFTAFFEVRRAFKMFEENKQNHPGFIPNYTGLGLLHILIGSIPENYQWITGALGLEGDIDKGIAELNKVLRTSTQNLDYRVFATESLFYLSFIQLNLAPENAKALQFAKMIDTISVSSPLIIFAKANFYLKTGQNEKALQALRKRTELKYSYPFHYLEYLHGSALMHKLDPEAIEYFKSYISDFAGRSYVASACQRIGWMYLLQNNKAAYARYMRKALEAPGSIMGSDDEAKREARSGQVPDTGLLKARLLFDGGYYKQVLNILDKIDPDLYHDLVLQTEYFYRRGRVLQLMKNHKEALINFRKAIELGNELDRYYAGFAALQAGIIYDELGQEAKAREYLNYCLNLDFDEYERSIKHKAKARLETLK